MIFENQTIYPTRRIGGNTQIFVRCFFTIEAPKDGTNVKSSFPSMEKFSNCLFIDCRFQGVAFFGNSFTSCIFRDCVFEGAKFDRSWLKSVMFIETLFQGSHFCGCNFESVAFKLCEFTKDCWFGPEHDRGGSIEFDSCTFDNFSNIVEINLCGLQSSNEYATVLEVAGRRIVVTKTQLHILGACPMDISNVKESCFDSWTPNEIVEYLEENKGLIFHLIETGFALKT